MDTKIIEIQRHVGLTLMLVLYATQSACTLQFAQVKSILHRSRAVWAGGHRCQIHTSTKVHNCSRTVPWTLQAIFANCEANGKFISNRKELFVCMLVFVRLTTSRRCSNGDEPLILWVLDLLSYHQPLWLNVWTAVAYWSPFLQTYPKEATQD